MKAKIGKLLIAVCFLVLTAQAHADLVLMDFFGSIADRSTLEIAFNNRSDSGNLVVSITFGKGLLVTRSADIVYNEKLTTENADTIKAAFLKLLDTVNVKKELNIKDFTSNIGLTLKKIEDPSPLNARCSPWMVN